MNQQLPVLLNRDKESLSTSGFTIGNKTLKCGSISIVASGTFRSSRPRQSVPIAVKVIPLPCRRRVPFVGDYFEFFNYDRNASKTMKHVHLLAIYDFFIFQHSEAGQSSQRNISSLSKSLFIFMEFAAGGSLEDLLAERGGPLNEAEARFYYLQFGEAVAFMHSCDFEHGNIKCEKILLVDEERRVCKLADFVFQRQCFPPSTITSGGYLKDTFCPSAAYLAPEVLHTPMKHRRPQRPEMTQVDQMNSDVWSVGVVLYFLLHNRLPFTCWNLKFLIDSQLKKEFILDRRLSAQTKQFISDHLEPNYDARPTMQMLMECTWVNSGDVMPFE